ncbi:DUF1671-domain-containing protein [Patellaria atrata CBS 101060]|uniref:DUF1671-domain-containing protein n=1 Tax=Patellaria atrata CBS 101060 TaxID=1346257 RepID=A0A9P4SGU9_9PEZI|nr:DUF1671-domain-containing protein [Patellaria atrata CBS 101060]
MVSSSSLFTCPFCSYLVDDEYVITLHVEEMHTEDSPFVVTSTSPPEKSSRMDVLQHSSSNYDTGSSDGTDGWVTCPVEDCEEEILISEWNDHMDYHEADRLADGQKDVSERRADEYAFIEQNFKTDIPGELRSSPQKRSRHHRSSSEKTTLSRSIFSFGSSTKEKSRHKSSTKSQFNATEQSARLGRSELGPHAYEEKMPRWLYDQLERGGKVTANNIIGPDGRTLRVEMIENETQGLIALLAQLSNLDKTVREAFFCHPSTTHVGKTPREGGFCGYRNIQMFVSYIQGAKTAGHEHFPGRLPTILKIQDWIERAWDQGFNEIGRVQTGGIRGTRKYIGTPEAQALCLYLGIPCDIVVISDIRDGSQAHEQLLSFVEEYFKTGVSSNKDSKVHRTHLPPIYLQQPGHSLTIIGFEKRRDGSCNLLVFDPMFKTTDHTRHLVGRDNLRTARPQVIHVYRRGAKRLRRHRDFELLCLRPSVASNAHPGPESTVSYY